MSSRSSCDFVATAPLAGAFKRWVMVVELVAYHKMEDIHHPVGVVSFAVTSFACGTAVIMIGTLRGEGTHGTWVKLNATQIRKPAAKIRFSTLVKKPLSEAPKLFFWPTEAEALRPGSSGVVSSVAILID